MRMPPPTCCSATRNWCSPAGARRQADVPVELWRSAAEPHAQTVRRGRLGEVIPPNRVICQDEMLEGVEAEAFQQRLWEMFSVRFHGALSLPQIDRFAGISSPRCASSQRRPICSPPTSRRRIWCASWICSRTAGAQPGEGHRVIHGVAGSGKTLILGYRAEHLAQVCAKPILILCYNESLARRIGSVMRAKG